MIHSFRRGLKIAVPGEPVQEVRPGNDVASVALHGADFPGIRAELLVAEGDKVKRGTAVFRDRKRPQVVVTSPVCGTVEMIKIGARRRLTSITISKAGDQPVRFQPPATPTRAAVQSLLQQTGLWSLITSRPFGRIPDPASVPDAIFVTALQTDPLCARADVVIAQAAEVFAAGMAMLKPLTDGPVFLCQGNGVDAAPTDNQIRLARFRGVHPAGLPGTHIDRLFPIRGNRVVWQIHYQHIIALGTALCHGHLPQDQVIALAGSGVQNPRLIRAPAGATLDDLLQDELSGEHLEVLSGSPLSGHASRHLRRHHWQVSVMQRPRPNRPNRPKAKAWLPKLSQTARPRPVIPTQALERALGPNLPVIPLIRALSIGDVETADRLGCRGLLEEDMALATYASGGTLDFAALLRNALNEIEARA